MEQEQLENYTRARIMTFKHVFGTSLTHIAKESGISRTTLSRFMSGESRLLGTQSLNRIHGVIDYLDGNDLTTKHMDFLHEMANERDGEDVG